MEPTANCPYNYSSEWVSKQHSKAVAGKCAAPFSCDESIITDTFSVMACPGGDPAANATYFGIPSMALLGENGYADFLYAIADNDFVNRGGELKDTGEKLGVCALSVGIQSEEWLLTLTKPQATSLTRSRKASRCSSSFSRPRRG